MADSDTVKVQIVFDADMDKIGEKRDVSAQEAKVLVRQGRATYATDAQERKAEKALANPA